MKRRVHYTHDGFYIYGKMEFDKIDESYYVVDNTLTDIKVFNTKRQRITSSDAIEILKTKIEESDFLKFCFYCDITESKIVFCPVKCYEIIDNIVFMICGKVKCSLHTNGTKILISEEIYDIKIYEQRYVYEPTIEYGETDCETLKEIIIDRIKDGYYNYALIDRYSSQFTNPFKK